MIKVKLYDKDKVEWDLLTSAYTEARYQNVVAKLKQSMIPYKLNMYKNVEYQIIVPHSVFDKAFERIKNLT